MATLYTEQSKNVSRTWFLMGLFLVLIIGLGFIFSQAWGDSTILYIAVIFSLMMNLISFWFADKIALSLSGAKPATPELFPELHRIVENLAITAGLPKPRVYVINDFAPNAFATGRNKHHAAVAVTTGLLQMLDRSELEGVIAHELAHIGNRDILVSMVAVVLAGCVSILANMFLRVRLVHGGGRDRGGNVAAVLMLVGVILAVLAPIFATLIQLAISRKREFLADASGALHTRYPEGLASALKKISSYSAPMQRANDATAHLFIASPFGARALRGLHKLFMTHPPIEERIRALLGQ